MSFEWVAAVDDVPGGRGLSRTAVVTASVSLLLAGCPPLSGVPAESRFDASASSDPDGRVVRYDWDFGDGTVLHDTAAEVRHTYSRSGQFRVTVTVHDNEACGARLLFSGQTALCNGSEAALSTVVVNVRG